MMLQSLCILSFDGSAVGELPLLGNLPHVMTEAECNPHPRRSDRRETSKPPRMSEPFRAFITLSQDLLEFLITITLIRSRSWAWLMIRVLLVGRCEGSLCCLGCPLDGNAIDWGGAIHRGRAIRKGRAIRQGRVSRREDDRVPKERFMAVL